MRQLESLNGVDSVYRAVRAQAGIVMDPGITFTWQIEREMTFLFTHAKYRVDVQ